MSTVIYLANQIIQIVEGTAGKKGASISNCISLQAPEGSIINGMIMDAEVFSAFLTEAFMENRISTKDVTLVINSTKFIGRRMELPAMKPAQEMEYIARDYTESGRAGEEMIYGYISLSSQKGKLKSIYAEGIEEEFINDYLDIFAKAGIKLKSIYSGESCLINHSSQMVKSGLRTYLMMIIEGTSLIQILFVNGVFYYYNSVRCFQDIGSVEYGMNMARSVSQIMQFMKSERIEETIECVVIAGDRAENLDNYQEGFELSGLDVPLSAYQVTANVFNDSNIHEFFPSVSGLSELGRNSDFYYSIMQRKKNRRFSRETIRAITVVASVFAAMFAVFLTLFSIKMIKQAELNKLIEYNQDPITMMDVMEYDGYAERNEFLKQERRAIAELKENIATYPCGNSTVQRVIDSCASGYADITYDSFESERGVISITAQAPLVDDINKFIKNLTERDEFYKIDYTGYDYDDHTGMWLINVNCILAEGAGR